MSETSILPFFHWGECNADSKINADRIDLEIVEAEPFDSTYSSNIKAKVTFDYHKDELMNIPLWNYKSKNQALLRQYMTQFEKGKIKINHDFLQHKNEFRFSYSKPKKIWL